MKTPLTILTTLCIFLASPLAFTDPCPSGDQDHSTVTLQSAGDPSMTCTWAGPNGRVLKTISDTEQVCITNGQTLICKPDNGPEAPTASFNITSSTTIYCSGTTGCSEPQ